MKRWYKLFAVLFVCLLSLGSMGYLGIQHSEKAAYAADPLTPINLDTSSCTFTPVGISDSSTVGGNIQCTGASFASAATWQSGSGTALPSPGDPGMTYYAEGISSSSEVVGIAYFSQPHAAKWDSNGTPTDLGGPTSGTCDQSNGATEAIAVNDAGEIVGVCSDYSNYAGYWPGGAANSFTKLPDLSNSIGSIASGVNHSGNIVGITTTYDPASGLGQVNHAVRWQNGTVTDISPAGGIASDAVAINDNNLAVGTVNFNTDSYNHAYVWDLASNHNYDLYTLTGHSAHATAVNNSGAVVGDFDTGNGDPNTSNHAFMWKAGSGFVDLNNLLASNSGWTLTSAVGINSSGQIVGTGLLNGQSHAYLLNTSPTLSGTWITPEDGFSVKAGTSLQLSASAHPAQAGSSIQHIDFAANWNGTWQTVCTTTSSSNTFGCDWNLTDAVGTPIPNGGLQVRFTIFDSSGTSTQSPVLQGTIAPPHVHQKNNFNWAGYVVTGMQYTDVKGSWVQPAISCTKKETSNAFFWVGLDGFSTIDVEQIGTAAICRNGKVRYYVWQEMYPDKPVVIYTSIQPGEHVQAEVSYRGNDKFKLSIILSGVGNTWTNPLTVLTRKGATRSSAEWIAEAPCQKTIAGICTNRSWPQFGIVTFTNCSEGGISIASGPEVIKDTMTYGLFNSLKGLPSSLNSNNTGFSVQWKHE